jgi:uncharacterized protein YkwD
MALNDTITTIEAELEALKAEVTPAAVQAEPATPEPATPEPATPEPATPEPIQLTTVSPLHDMILAQANERFARDTYFKN